MYYLQLTYKWIITHLAELFKWSLASLASFIAILEPTLPFILISFVFIIGDCITSYRLARRVKKKTGKASGKFQSNKFGKVLITSLIALALICLAFLVEKYILVMYKDIYLANYVAFLVCFKELWSMLENESSCSNSKWAKVLQKVMIDKAERHFDIDLSGLEEKQEP
jgi:Na+/H+ antiporter NhaD/arsenite permease-like protein